MADPHAKLGILQGFYRYQEKRGRYEVRGVGTNLWMSAAQGLGFQVLMVQFKDAGYRCILLTPDFAAKIMGWGPGTYCGCPSNMSAVFIDADSLPPSLNFHYWESWTVVHVFFDDSSGYPH